MSFKPVTLTKAGKTRKVETANEETKLRFDGWKTAKSESPKPSAPKSDSK